MNEHLLNCMIQYIKAKEQRDQELQSAFAIRGIKEIMRTKTFGDSSKAEKLFYDAVGLLIQK